VFWTIIIIIIIIIFIAVVVFPRYAPGGLLPVITATPPNYLRHFGSQWRN
jgi:hypothetical protein